MNINLNSKDIQLNELRRQAAEAEALHYRVGQGVTPSRSFAIPRLPHSARLILIAVILILSLIVMTHVTLARDTADSGQGQAFSDAILNYRLGHYYFVTGDYEKAIAEYSAAIEAIPATVFEQHLDYAVMY